MISGMKAARSFDRKLEYDWFIPAQPHPRWWNGMHSYAACNFLYFACLSLKYRISYLIFMLHMESGPWAKELEQIDLK